MGDAVVPPAEPVRTCIGCRRRDQRSNLLRMVVDARVASQALIVPDPAQRLPGRGAWVHPTTVCLDQAERRRAIGRALRLRTAADLQEVRAYVEAWQTAVVDADDRQHHRRGAGGQEENRKRV